MAKSGFTSVWLPPPTQSLSSEGRPANIIFPYTKQSCKDKSDISFYRISTAESVLPSCYGSLDELKALLQKMNEHHVRALKDPMGCIIVMMVSRYHGINTLLHPVLVAR
jgi:alpha-amylase